MEHIEVMLILLLLYICYVTGNGPVPVIGRVEGSVLLPYCQPVSVVEVTWDFPCNGHRVKVAEFRNQKFSITGEEFRSRMDCCDNGTSVMIRNLTVNDSGIYTALIYDTEHRRHEISYNLTVFELVPKPEIKWEKKWNEDGQCYYTLNCSVQSDSPALSYSWMYRYNNSEYQHYANGSTIQISAHKNTREFLCLVQNPVNEENTAFVVSTCPEKGNKRIEEVLILSVITSVCFLAAVFGFLILRKSRLVKKNHDIIYTGIGGFPLKSTNQNVCNQNGTNRKPLLYPETTYVDVKR
ncbi:SLAM family member 9 [Xenopus tropicalis]|uniref:SLAM family member 9 n=1 Tax=Xenopus tropicalis TaxID=8364 RepID=A0A803JRE6_XENTR|nr:SLAM family member 9 [Xenopus tropicalis]